MTKKNEDEDKEQSKKKYRVEVIQFGTFGQGFPDAEELEDTLNEFSAEGRKVEIMTIAQRGLLVLGTMQDPHPLAVLFNREPPQVVPDGADPMRVVVSFAKLVQEFQRECQTKPSETAADTVVQAMLKHIDLPLAREVADHLQKVHDDHVAQHPPGSPPCGVTKDFAILREALLRAINANVS